MGELSRRPVARGLISGFAETRVTLIRLEMEMLARRGWFDGYIPVAFVGVGMRACWMKLLEGGICPLLEE